MNPTTIDDQEELRYRLALSFIPGVGTRRGRQLIERFGSAAAIFRQPLRDLRKAEGMSDIIINGFRDKDVLHRADKELLFVARNDIRVLFQGYPKRLMTCNDAPVLLYFKGHTDLDAKRVVAIVGTRKSTDYGHQVCAELVEALSELDDVLVVSGLALGIDAVAHKTAVQQKIPTVGVLGHGLDRIYPFNHRTLAQQMEECGGLLTEFPSETLTDRNNFPIRNRIVAGMSDVTVVVESNLTGGALITALMAHGYNREVAAYPGRAIDTRSAGCNEIIRTQVATMITKPAELMELMQWGVPKKRKALQTDLFHEYTPEEKKVTEVLATADSVHADDLMVRTGIHYSQLASTLLQLEMSGIVRALPGKMYRLS